MSDQMIEAVAVPIVWGSVSGLPVLTANQFVAQFATHVGPGRDEVILTAGFIAPPIITGSEEFRRSAVDEIDRVEVQPLVRLCLNRGRLIELKNLIENMLRQAKDLEDLDGVQPESEA